MKLRPDRDPDWFHRQQRETLPGRFGLEVVRIEQGLLHAQLRIADWMRAPNGYLHAASVICLADTGAGYACLAHLPEDAQGFTTIEMKSNFFATARDGAILATGRPLHAGRNTQVWDVEVDSEDGRRVAAFRCTQMILWPKS